MRFLVDLVPEMPGPLIHCLSVGLQEVIWRFPSIISNSMPVMI